MTVTAFAEALFVSGLQPSEKPSPADVRSAVSACTDRFHEAGCAALVAQEYGEHPEACCERMRWARAAVVDAYT